MDIRRKMLFRKKTISSGGGDSEIDTTTIYYTSSDGNIVTPYRTTAFGANIVSNNYINGQGIITFDGSVTSIGDSAFYKCTRLTSVIIPDSVTSIGKMAFERCESLTSVNIPDGVTMIGIQAFFSCSLTSITIPDSVTSIGFNAFKYCSLTSVTIGDGVTAIGNCGFAYCGHLTSVYCKAITPPSGDYGMFLDNASGRKIYVPTGSVNAYKSTEYWSEYADAIVGYDFEDDGEVDIDTTYAIYYTSSDGNIVTPYKTDVFGANIVSNNYINGQGIINFDGTVTTIGYEAFNNRSSLTSITIPDSVTTIGGYAFYYCSSLTSVTIPDSVTTIGGSAFFYCESLTSITIPDSVTAIGNSAFQRCESLTSITIPDGVTEIKLDTFRNCISLTSVFCKAVTPPAGGSSMFYGNASGRKIYVPMESVEAYKSASYWKNYASDIVGYNF